MKLNLRQTTNGVLLDCHVTPRAKRSSVKGERNGALAIALGAPPVDGKANEALIEFIAGLANVSKSDVEIVKGHCSRSKTLLIQRVSIVELNNIIDSYRRARVD